MSACRCAADYFCSEEIQSVHLSVLQLLWPLTQRHTYTHSHVPIFFFPLSVTHICGVLLRFTESCIASCCCRCELKEADPQRNERSVHYFSLSHPPFILRFPSSCRLEVTLSFCHFQQIKCSFVTVSATNSSQIKQPWGELRKRETMSRGCSVKLQPWEGDNPYHGNSVEGWRKTYRAKN